MPGRERVSTAVLMMYEMGLLRFCGQEKTSATTHTSTSGHTRVITAQGTAIGVGVTLKCETTRRDTKTRDHVTAHDEEEDKLAAKAVGDCCGLYV